MQFSFGQYERRIYYMQIKKVKLTKELLKAAEIEDEPENIMSVIEGDRIYLNTAYKEAMV